MQHIRWTEEGEASFEDIEKTINACPKLFFLDGAHPI
jgi:hypothetical protein